MYWKVSIFRFRIQSHPCPPAGTAQDTIMFVFEWNAFRLSLYLFHLETPVTFNGQSLIIQICCSRYIVFVVVYKSDVTHNFQDHFTGTGSGARLTKAYDVTIQRYRNLHAKIEDSKIHILRCMGSKFCVKFQRFLLKFHTKFWTHTTQNMHFTRC